MISIVVQNMDIITMEERTGDVLHVRMVNILKVSKMCVKSVLKVFSLLERSMKEVQGRMRMIVLGYVLLDTINPKMGMLENV